LKPNPDGLIYWFLRSNFDNLGTRPPKYLKPFAIFNGDGLRILCQFTNCKVTESDLLRGMSYSLHDFLHTYSIGGELTADLSFLKASAKRINAQLLSDVIIYRVFQDDIYDQFNREIHEMLDNSD
jgi:hypothetical protein